MLLTIFVNEGTENLMQRKYPKPISINKNYIDSSDYVVNYPTNRMCKISFAGGIWRDVLYCAVTTIRSSNLTALVAVGACYLQELRL